MWKILYLNLAKKILEEEYTHCALYCYVKQNPLKWETVPITTTPLCFIISAWYSTRAKLEIDDHWFQINPKNSFEKIQVLYVLCIQMDPHKIHRVQRKTFQIHRFLEPMDPIFNDTPVPLVLDQHNREGRFFWREGGRTERSKSVYYGAWWQ